MDEAMSVGLQDEIISELTTELQGQPTFNADVLAIKVKNAIREVKNRRNYAATSYTDEQIEKDLYDNYYTNIKNLALYDFTQIGANFETSHSENSTSRTWVEREKMFNGIIPFAKVL
ncbi:MAG: hypothetical protein ACI4EU_02990 [Butyrivibrio sp.]